MQVWSWLLVLYFILTRVVGMYVYSFIPNGLVSEQWSVLLTYVCIYIYIYLNTHIAFTVFAGVVLTAIDVNWTSTIWVFLKP